MIVSDNQLVVNQSKEVAFERGFKTWCDNTSVSIRKKLGLYASSPLSPTTLAQELGVTILPLQNIPLLDQSTKDYLASPQGDEWSAVTVQIGTKNIVVVNPSHSPARQASNIMHELAHVIRGHKASQMVTLDSEYILRDYDVKQEAEADWFAGCLLLPRPALIRCMKSSLSEQEVLQIYGVSRDLYRYRLGVSGVSKQFR